MAECDFINYNKFSEFDNKLPQEHRLQFKAAVEEGKLLARPSPQVLVDATETACHSVAT